MPKRIAICIGINSYRNRPQADLQFAHKDARDIASLLRDPLRGGFDSVIEIFDHEATKETLLYEIDQVFSAVELTSQDLLLLYFSGHGALDSGDNLYLVPHDINFRSDNSVHVTTALHIKELEVLLENTKAGYVVVLLDACHSGGVGKLLGRIKYRDHANIILVGASRFSQKAWETPELQHGRFTECILRAANDRPTFGEWITLQQILAHTQHEMQKMGDDQSIEVSSHFVNPNIGIFKNPLYSLITPEFVEETKGLFKLAGYNILEAQTVDIYPNVFAAQERLGFGRQSQTIVMCLNNSIVNVVDTHITQFKTVFQSLKQETQAANGIIVTAHDIPHALKKLLVPFLSLEIKTIDELQRSLINFDRYLEYLIDDFDKGNPELSYEPLLKDCYIELNTNLKRGDQTMSITEVIDEWLVTDQSPSAIVLGGYGTGKTTFSRKIARDLASRCLNSGNNYDLRIPILLYLREFPRTHIDIEAFIIAHLKRRCRVTNPDYEAFQLMNDAGLLLLIFDGFDEMVVRADQDTIRRNLAAIERFANNPKAKILLTSRPEFFRSVQEERDLFLSPDALTRKRPRYRQIALLPLSHEQVELYLKKRIQPKDPTKDWTYYRDQINNIPGFQDLTKRPVLLEMIVKTLPKLIEENLEINRATLYNTYLRSEIARQQETKQRQLLINQEERFHLMQIIARCFYTENPAGLTAERIQDLLKNEFSRQHREELEAHMRDFLTASFLLRENDQYRFSHRSIMEYLAARDLAEEIKTQTPQIFKTHKLTPEVRDFIIDLKPDPDVSWRETLWSWIRVTAGDSKDDVGYLGGNAITVLNFMKESFQEKDFQNTILKGAIFSRANCVGASFRGCNLEGADLSACDLGGADLTDAFLFFDSPCNQCGTSNPVGSAFCDNCGASLLSLTGMILRATSVRGVLIHETKGLDAKPKHLKDNDLTLRELMLRHGATEGKGVVAKRGEYVEEKTEQTTHVFGIICPTCETQNVYDAITCSTCGTSFRNKPEPVEYVCSECRAKIIPGLRFCGMCGNQLAQIQCSSCHTLNSQERNKCYRCNSSFILPQDVNISSISSKSAKPSLLCPYCGEINPPDVAICQNCSYGLREITRIFCPQCRTPVQSGTPFCDNCGTTLFPFKPPPPLPIVSRSTTTRKTTKIITNCPNCRNVVQPGATFCDVCGSPLELPIWASPWPVSTSPLEGVCSQCRTPYLQGEAFCGNCGAALLSLPVFTPSSLLSTDTLLANRYRVLKIYKQGGFSTVYLAEDTNATAQYCVIKGVSSSDQEALELLKRETEFLSALSHTGLPKVLNVIEDGTNWYPVIDFIDGPTLSELMLANTGPLRENEVIDWAIQICDILDYLHNQYHPIIVRDIKPENFVVRESDNKIVLIDLSISRHYKPGKAKDTDALGTAGFAAPEQHGVAQTDARSDIYCLGVTLLSLLTAHDPTTTMFNHPAIHVLNPNLNPGWDVIITKSTKLRAEERYQSAVEMKEALVQLSDLMIEGISSKPKAKGFLNRLRNLKGKTTKSWRN